MRALHVASLMLAGALLMPLGGCGSTDNSALKLAVIGESAEPFTAGNRSGLAGQLVRAATAEGLVSFDEEGRVIPALADRWIVTDDGQSYIFRLRDGTWRNGDEITAQSAKEAFEKALRALKGTALGLDLSGVDEVRVMAGRVIEIRLNRPMPFLLQLLAQPELGLIHDKQGGGPMMVDARGQAATLTPIEPSRLGLPQVNDWAERTRQLVVRVLDGAGAVDAFNNGQIDLVLGGRLQDFPLTSSVGILRGTIQLDPVSGLFGLAVTNGKGFLASPENREALAMAIDRDGLISAFGVGGWSPTDRIVASGVEGDPGQIGERWAGLTLEDRRKTAGERVQAWRSSQLAKPKDGNAAASQAQPGEPPKPPPLVLRVWLPDGEGTSILFRKIATDFASIGVGVLRVHDADDADLTLIDEVARYPRARWYLNRLSCQARHGLCDKPADDLVAEAAATTDAAQRAQLLTDAEVDLTKANVYIPFGPPIRWSLVRGSVRGFEPNTWGWHPLMPLAWLPK